MCAINLIIYLWAFVNLVIQYIQKKEKLILWGIYLMLCPVLVFGLASVVSLIFMPMFVPRYLLPSMGAILVGECISFKYMYKQIIFLILAICISVFFNITCFYTEERRCQAEWDNMINDIEAVLDADTCFVYTDENVKMMLTTLATIYPDQRQFSDSYTNACGKLLYHIEPINLSGEKCLIITMRELTAYTCLGQYYNEGVGTVKIYYTEQGYYSEP